MANKHTPKLETGLYMRIPVSDYNGSIPLPQHWKSWNESGNITDDSYIYIDDDGNWIPSDAVSDQNRWYVKQGVLIDRDVENRLKEDKEYAQRAAEIREIYRRYPNYKTDTNQDNPYETYYFAGAHGDKYGPRFWGSSDRELVENHDKLIASGKIDEYYGRDPLNNELNWLLFGGAGLSRLGVSTAASQLKGGWNTVRGWHNAIMGGLNRLGERILTPLGNQLAKIGIEGYFAKEGAENLASDEGVAKTKRLIGEGEYLRAAKSGLGDALDVSFVAGPILSAGKTIKNTKNAYNTMRLAKAVNEAKIDVPKLRLDNTNPNHNIFYNPSNPLTMQNPLQLNYQYYNLNYY